MISVTVCMKPRRTRDRAARCRPVVPMQQPLEAPGADPMSHRDAAAAAKEETMSDTQNTPPFPDTEPASMNGAAAPADTRSRAALRSGYIYGSTTKPSLASMSVALIVS